MSNANAPATSWFQGFASAPTNKGGNYVNPGVYDVDVVSFQRQLSTRPETLNHQLGIIEVRIVEVVTRFEAVKDDAGKVIFPASNAVGEVASSIANTTKHRSTALGNLKGFLLAALRTRQPSLAETDLDAGVNPDGSERPEQWSTILAQATNPPGKMLAGTRLRLHASRTRTTKGAPFTALRWEAIARPAEATA